MTPYIAEMGVAHCIALYSTEESQSHHGILPKSQGDGVFSSTTEYRQSQIVTPVVAVSMGVTTPCSLVPRCFERERTSDHYRKVFVDTAGMLAEPIRL